MIEANLGRRHHTLALALVTAALVLATMAVHVASLGWMIESLRILSGGGHPGSLQPTPDVLMAAWIGLGLAGCLAWGIWMGQVAHNVPLLGGGYPIVTPLTAIVEAVIPVYNVYRCPPVMRELTARLADDGRPALGLITPWTLLGIAFLLLFRALRRLIVLFAVDEKTALTWALMANLAEAACLLLAGVLAIALLAHVERAQGRRARRLGEMVANGAAEVPGT